MESPFWIAKSLAELTHEEWESLCDRCGLCCLHRLQGEEENDPVLTTRVICRGFDTGCGQCRDYTNRFSIVEGCTQLTPLLTAEFDWLPATCAYRLRYHGEPLPQWHPLITGTFDTVKPYGIHSMDIVLETDDIDLEDFIIEEE